MSGSVPINALTVERVTFQITVGTTSTAITTKDWRAYQPVWVAMKSNGSNAGTVYVGNKIMGIGFGETKRKIDDGSGWPLTASEQRTAECSDPRQYSAIASQASQTLHVEVGFAQWPGQEATTS
jgi:hypothetical protein